jgi:hypothetical protein
MTARQFNSIRPNSIATALVAVWTTLTASSMAGSQLCTDWSTVPSPTPSGALTSIVRDVVAIAPDDVWAVGGWSGIVDGTMQTFAFTMHWDGVTWSFVPTPQPTACVGCTNVTLWAVDATGPNDVWAAGDKRVQSPDGFLGTHILVMHWNGSQWTVMNTPLQSGASGDMVWGLKAIAPNDVWFMGEGFYGGSPLIPNPALAMHWNGSSFVLTTVPSVNPQTSGFGDGNALRAASALSPNDVWAVGAASDGDSMPAGHSQIQHWNGSTWQNVPGPSPGVWHDLDAVVAISPNDVWAGGEYFDSAYHGLALHFNGASWTQVPIPGGVSDFVAFAGNDIYAAGAGIMHWDGAAWTTVDAFPEVPEPTLAGLDASGPCELWAGGRQFVDGILVPLTVRSNTPQTPAGDLNGDGHVNTLDLGILLSSWSIPATAPGCSGAKSCPSDMNADGFVNSLDLGILLSHWG